jgi:hypothetical protein
MGLSPPVEFITFFEDNACLDALGLNNQIEAERLKVVVSVSHIG